MRTLVWDVQWILDLSQSTNRRQSDANYAQRTITRSHYLVETVEQQEDIANCTVVYRNNDCCCRCYCSC